MEETYKQSREEAEDGGDGGERRGQAGEGHGGGGIAGEGQGGREQTGDRQGGGEQVGDRQGGGGQPGSQAGSYHISDMQLNADEERQETVGETISQGNKVVAEKQSAVIENKLVLTTPSKSLGIANTSKQVHASQENLIASDPEKSSEKNLQAVDESQYPLPDTGSKANLDFVTLRAAPTFSKNTKYSKEAKDAWKTIMNSKERKMPAIKNLQEPHTPATNRGIGGDDRADANINAALNNKDSNRNIKSNLNEGENMLRSLGSSRTIRKKLPIRTT